MADNTAKIAELEEILRQGVTQTTIDGVTIVRDLDSVRAELRQLKAEDDTIGNRRPQSFTVDLGGF